MTESSIKISDGNSDIGYILEIYLEFPNQFGNPHNELLFFARRGNSRQVRKRIYNLHESKKKKKKFCAHQKPTTWLEIKNSS